MTGDENTAAIRGGEWAAVDEAAVPFRLSADESFTVEGWFSTKIQSKPAILVGNRGKSGETNTGWMVYLLPPPRPDEEGSLGFRLEGTGTTTEALLKSKDIISEDANHFAAIWDATAVNLQTGKLKIYLNGQVAESPNIPHTQIMAQEGNSFRLGTNFRGTLDEFRFTARALKPAQFLLKGGGATKAPQRAVLMPTSNHSPGEWLYTTSEPSKNWNSNTFNDRSWKKAQSGFGAGMGDPNTEWKTEKIWLRRTFELPNPVPPKIQLRALHDDDAKVFLNGVLAAELPGAISDYKLFNISAESQRALKPGPNIIAIVCTQKTGAQYIDTGIEAVK